MNRIWSPSKLIQLYKIQKTKTSILNDEANGLIPKALRHKNMSRFWEQKDLPALGKIYGFLRPPITNKILAFYAPKGGVLKTTTAFNFARNLALNNIKTLVIGLDVNHTITRNLSQEIAVSSLEDIQSTSGIFEASNGLDISKTIKPTDLPTLFYIPESSNLNHLEQKIRDESRREHFIERLIKPLQKEFKVIIFDNSPNWNFLIQNSLVAATDIICPVACDIEAFRSIAQNIQMINDFKEKMELSWSNFILIPTKLEHTNLSKQIEAEYRRLFPQLITAGSIRYTVKGQESSFEKLSVIEYDCLSSLADDYYDVVKDIWERINP